jgi:outer membrane protein assembly factor BamB
MDRRQLLASLSMSAAGFATGMRASFSAESISSPEASDSNWPAFRGAGAKGVADGFPLPENWRVLWQSPVPGLGHSSPTIWGNRVYVATAVSEGGEVPLKLGLFGDRDAAEENDRQSWIVMCFDKKSGELLWEKTARSAVARTQRHLKATQANTTLSTDGERLIAFFGSEGLYCYSLDGELLWSKDFGTINVSKYGVGWGYASSPALHGDRIVLQCDAPDDPYLVAVSMDDGKEIWRVPRAGICERSWATPYIHESEGRTQVIANGWPFVVSYDLASGEELWRLQGGGDNPVPTPFSAHGLIYIASGHGAVAPVWAIRPDASGEITVADGETSNDYVVWTEMRNGAYLMTPLVYRDCLYSGTNNGILKCYDALTGEPHYQKRLGNGTTALSASPVAGDGKIYWTTEEGDVHVVEAGPEYRELAVNHLGEQAMATPALSEGVLYFRTRRSLIAVGT